MAWRPETFTPEQRRAAASTIAHAQNVMWRQDRNEFGSEHTGAVTQAYLRVEDLLTMIYESMYPLSEQEKLPGQPPSMS